MLEEYGLPGNIRVPFVYFGVDNSLAGYYQNNTRVLMYGQMDATGKATPEMAVQVFGNEDQLFGPSSMLAQMIRVLRKNNSMAEVWAMPLEDSSSGIKAAWAVTFADIPVPQSELVYLLIAGTQYRITVLATDTNATAAAKMAAEINADIRCPVTASAAGDVLTLTARHSGAAAGGIDIRSVYRRQRIAAPHSAKLTITQTAVGAGDPTCATSLSNLADEPFDWICYPYLDAANLSAITNEMNDTSGRWNAMRQLYGHVFSAVVDTPANRVALGNMLNSQHLSILGLYGTPTPAYLIAAALTAKANLHLSTPPELSRPLQTIALECVLPPEVEDVDDKMTRQVMYFNGIGGVQVWRDGTVAIDRVLTTYHTNRYGAPDPSYLDVQTLAQLQYMIRYLQYRMTQTFPRHALKDDDDFLVPGSYTATPHIVKSYLVAWAQELEWLNVIEDIPRFITLLEVERDRVDPNVLNIIVRPDLVNQFRIAKILVQFFNEYPANAIPGIETGAAVGV